ncbi:hypothetical protein [Actinomadura miaoliensis]|uniref:Uncharacterized protein n=1 Tax=Actinomadura miaoliensis TaxID=430685 RepID=A0ABP7V6S7_9ACTN
MAVLAARAQRYRPALTGQLPPSHMAARRFVCMQAKGVRFAGYPVDAGSGSAACPEVIRRDDLGPVRVLIDTIERLRRHVE